MGHGGANEEEAGSSPNNSGHSNTIGGGIFQGWRSARTFRPRWKDNSANSGPAGGSRKEKGNDFGPASSSKTNTCNIINDNENSEFHNNDKEGRLSNQAPASSTSKKNSEGGNKSSSKFRHHIDVTLGSGNLRSAVKLPAGEDYNEWLAVNTIDFYNAINLLYGVVSEFCTEISCPMMNAGPKYEYRWADGIRYKKPIVCSAPKYVDYLMEWVENQVDNVELFPQNPGSTYVPHFEDIVKTILRRLFRVYAHIYHCHFRQVCKLGAEAHLNTCFKHFVYFVQEFKLIDNNELAPLQEIISGI